MGYIVTIDRTISGFILFSFFLFPVIPASADNERTLPDAYLIEPTVVLQKTGEQLVVIEVLSDDQKVGELVMGETTLKEALVILPPHPGDGARRTAGMASWIPRVIRKTLKGIKYSYEPAFGSLSLHLSLGFNREKKLIEIFTTVPNEQVESLPRKLKSMVEMVEVKRKVKVTSYQAISTSIRQGKLTDCVSLFTESRLGWPGIAASDNEKLKSCERNVGASEYAKATACLEEVLNKDPDSALAHYWLGLTYLWSGEEESTGSQLDILKRLKPALGINLLEVMQRDRPEWSRASDANEMEILEQLDLGALSYIFYYYSCPTHKKTEPDTKGKWWFR